MTKKRDQGAASADATTKNKKRRSNARKRPGKHAISFKGATNLCKPSFRDQCDINNIVNRFQETGHVSHLARGEPAYGDAPDQDLFQAAVIAAEVKSAAEEGLLDEIGKEPENGSEDVLEDVQEDVETASETVPETNEGTEGQ